MSNKFVGPLPTDEELMNFYTTLFINYGKTYYNDYLKVLKKIYINHNIIHLKFPIKIEINGHSYNYFQNKFTDYIRSVILSQLQKRFDYENASIITKIITDEIILKFKTECFEYLTTESVKMSGIFNNMFSHKQNKVFNQIYGVTYKNNLATIILRGNNIYQGSYININKNPKLILNTDGNISIMIGLDTESIIKDIY